MLPSMTVEQREGRNHGLTEPREITTQMVMDVLDAVNAVKQDKAPNYDQLLKYSPYRVTQAECTSALYDLGFKSFTEVTWWVENDPCVAMMVRVQYLAAQKGWKLKVERDFIDGAGLGVYQHYLNALKPVIEKAFDCKYHFKRIRPLVRLEQQTGATCPLFYNAIHPGHWAYPQGHGTKFATCLNVADQLWHIPSVDYHRLHLGLYLASQGRCGLGVHWLDDASASFALCGVPGYEEYIAPPVLDTQQPSLGEES